MAAGCISKRPTGSKLWRYRYRIAGKENLFALGDYPALGLSEARAQRAEARQLVKQGIHPSHNRKAVRLATHTKLANTFEAVAREWIAQKGFTGRRTTRAESLAFWKWTCFRTSAHSPFDR